MATGGRGPMVGLPRINLSRFGVNLLGSVSMPRVFVTGEVGVVGQALQDGPSGSQGTLASRSQASSIQSTCLASLPSRDRLTKAAFTVDLVGSLKFALNTC